MEMPETFITLKLQVKLGINILLLWYGPLQKIRFFSLHTLQFSGSKFGLIVVSGKVFIRDQYNSLDV